MKWLLVGSGALMIVVGFSCVVSGYPIVEVERGWALLISGATVLSGGAIVVALGLVLGKIEDVSRALTLETRAQTGQLAGAAISLVQPEAAAPAAPSFVDRALRDPGFADQTFAEQAFADQAAADQTLADQASARHESNTADEQARPEPVREESLAPSSNPASPAPAVRMREWKPPAFLKRQPPPEPAWDETAAALLASEAPILPQPSGRQGEASQESPLSSPAPSAHDSTPLSTEPPAAPESSAPLNPPDAAPIAPHAEHSPGFRRFPLRSLTLPRGPWPEPPLAARKPEQQPAPAEPPPAQEEKTADEPIAEDWFESALARLDDAEEPARQETQPAAPSDSAEHSPEAPAASEPAPAEPPEGEAPTPPNESADASAVESPAVIGRYETEGTIYVMYSDGSIDAETAGGVYRFESLAALKAHIERPA